MGKFIHFLKNMVTYICSSFWIEEYLYMFIIERQKFRFGINEYFSLFEVELIASYKEFHHENE